jgi:hypothetical protein
MRLKTYAEDSPAHLNIQYLLANAAALLRICKTVSGILTLPRNNATPDLIAKWDGKSAGLNLPS